MPPDSLANAIWNALHTTHQRLALTQNLALKYPADIAPFACLAENTPTALRDLHALLHRSLADETCQAPEGDNNRENP